MKRALLVGLVSVACGLLGTPTSAAAPPGYVGGHRTLLSDQMARRAHHGAPWRARVDAVRSPRARAVGAQGAGLERMVYGYLPYWEMGYEVPHWDLLGVLAWFAVGLDAQGHAIDWNGWGGDATLALAEESHANETPFVVTVTLFDEDAIGALLGDEAARAQTIQTCLELMAVADADGVNIDFEFVPASAKQDFVTFMTDLKAAVTDVQPNGWDGHVTLAGPAVDWWGSYDYDQLLIHTDGIMVMGYGYHYGGGNPGPNAPLFGGGIWGQHSVAWTVDDYLTYGGVENRDRIIIGLPWYGRRWPVADTSVPGISLGTGKPVWFEDAVPEAAEFGATYDADSHTPYYHKTMDGQLWQVWFDDPASFGEKLAHIVDKDLGGIGIWVLGYEGAEDGYWQEIADHLAGTPETPEPPAEPDVEGGEVDTEEGEVDQTSSDHDPDEGPVPDDLDRGDLPAVDTASRPDGADPTVGAVASSSRSHETRGGGCTGGAGGHLTMMSLLALGLLASRKRPRRRAG